MNSSPMRQPAKPGAANRHFYVFVAFLLLVFLTGGSSRGDMTALLFLRPLAVLFGAYALINLRWQDIKAVGAPLWLLLSVIVLAALQLVPLPPSIWQALPGRELVVEVDAALKLEGLWRPLTMSPSKTWNTLFALIIPLSALLLYALLDSGARRKAWAVLLIIGMLSAVWGMLQITGSARGPLYLYRITNFGNAVGLFANRNHHGVFLACMIVTAAWYFASLDPRKARASLLGMLSVGAMIIFLLAAMLTGSRAGLAAAAIATVGGLLFIASAPLIPAKVSLPGRKQVSGRWLVLVFAGIFSAFALLSAIFSRALALDRLIEEDPTEELRVQLLPVFEQMVSASFPAGFGFGSFEHVYKSFEPLELLNPKYLNLAHNDLAQWLIEGGLPALAILGVFILWLVRAALRVLRPARQGTRQSGRKTRVLSLFIIALLLVASLVDYPLRVPSLMVLFTIACARLSLTGPTDGARAAGDER